jgi:N-acetylmuramate 1-kinase
VTPERTKLAADFLFRAGWGNAARQVLAGDASLRHYDRLTKPNGETAILMDAPPDCNESVRPFVIIARHLNEVVGLSAPHIYSEDVANGFLLLEDLGDDLFVRVVPNAPQRELTLYTAAADVLVSLHRVAPPDLPVFGPDLMAEQASLVFDTWVQTISGPCATGFVDQFRTRLRDLLKQTTLGDAVMILRDYHAENLLWLPKRSGVARVGLLDFQDAMLAHPGYDLVSLLQDVRRDVPASIETATIAHFITQSGADDADFRTAYAVLGVQRNLRILAVFARLASALGKPHYATLIPRTWGHVRRGLAHPALSPIAPMLIDALPEPTAVNLQKLTRT